MIIEMMNERGNERRNEWMNGFFLMNAWKDIKYMDGQIGKRKQGMLSDFAYYFFKLASFLPIISKNVAFY